MIDFVKTKRHYIMALAIMFVVVSLSGPTYSLFINVDETDDFIYSTGNLELQFIEDEQISIQSAFPMIDSDGFKTAPYSLTIKNTGSLPYLFDLKMLSSTDDNVIDMQYIKYQVNDGKTSTLYASNGVIASNVLLYPEEEITFNVRVWLDISTPNAELGKTFVAKLATSGQSVYRTLDTSGANYPVLEDGMIPVYYDESVNGFRKADQSNMISDYGWYNYNEQKWANVVTINSSNKKIYDVTGRNDLEIDDVRTNNGNYVSDTEYLDIKLNNYNYSNISNIFRIKFSNLSDEKVYIISNDKMSYYYDTVKSKFVFKINNTEVYSSIFKLEEKTWHILGYTYNGNIVNFYVDGNKISSDSIGGSLSSSKSFKLATDSNFKELSNMEIGDVYIYNSILSDDEIKTNYSVNLNVVYNDLLVGYNDFLPKTLREYYMTEDNGVVINNDDVSSYYVWIPRFKYKLWNVTGTPGVDSYDAYNKGIEIEFENKTESSGIIKCEENVCYNDNLLITKVTIGDNNKYYTHPAFTNGSDELLGLWVSKYEISTSDGNCDGDNIDGCLSSQLKIESKIGNTVWRNNYLSNFYYGVKKTGDKYNVIKNTEWGALSYLTHSKYGLCLDNTCSNIGTNKTYISGNNVKDSTTGNMYGVFDLSGGASEFVMGSYSNLDNQLLLNSSHFGNIQIDRNEYDLYHENTFILGDATREIGLNNGIWYNNYNSFVNETNNWFIRGGIGTTDNNGVFYYNATTDNNSEYITTRIVIK